MEKSSPQNPHKIIVILGPTASGKSDLAVKIAKKLNGEIISADSRQVYKGLNIGSGKITKKEMMGIPHYLLDVASPKKIFTVAQYQKLARKKIEEIWRRKKLPIICGGTGFYIQAVIDGLIIPEVKPNQKLRKKLDKKTTEELFKTLRKKDPVRAKNIDRYNRRRLIRALEIIASLGKVPKSKAKPINTETLIIGIKKEGEELKSLIRQRLLKRLKQGMIAEVKKLHAAGVSWRRLENLGLEYRYVAGFLQKKISKDEMAKKLETEIRRYAKRQMTWFRRDKKITWTSNPKKALSICQDWLGF